ncbi:MAG: phosphoribosylanthranilate isomerase [Planctomycetota bacterium]
MFQIKICGVRLKSDIQAVGDAGGDAIGLNFFSRSIRSLDPDASETRGLARFSGELGLRRVGVFVNHAAGEMLRIASTIDLDAIQLHGDESLEDVRDLQESGLALIRAIKLPRTPLSPDAIDRKVNDWISAGFHLLLDADAGSHHGGSGKTLHWPSIQRWSALRPNVTWTLAGGLKPENIAEAITITGAKSFDTASGVECPKGVKNAGRISRFIDQIKTHPPSRLPPGSTDR